MVRSSVGDGSRGRSRDHPGSSRPGSLTQPRLVNNWIIIIIALAALLGPLAALAVAGSPVLQRGLPRAYFLPLRFERWGSGRCYRWLGVRRFKYWIPFSGDRVAQRTGRHPLRQGKLPETLDAAFQNTGQGRVGEGGGWSSTGGGEPERGIDGVVRPEGQKRLAGSGPIAQPARVKFWEDRPLARTSIRSCRARR